MLGNSDLNQTENDTPYLSTDFTPAPYKDWASIGHIQVSVKVSQHHVHTASVMHKFPNVIQHRHRALAWGASVRWAEAVAFQEGTKRYIIPSIEIHCQHPEEKKINKLRSSKSLDKSTTVKENLRWNIQLSDFLILRWLTWWVLVVAQFKPKSEIYDKVKQGYKFKLDAGDYFYEASLLS